uniref:Ig-like domain-containing protein n=1 Tax=Cyprinus carpio TaxID=7962 RepID=A0A8C2JC84_CYPCA
MRILIVSLCLLLLHKHGVSGAETDTIEPVLVMEGDSATLPAGETQAEDLKVWTFGPEETIIVINSEIKMFKDRLMVDQSTGSLTIENITAHFSGIYKLEIVRKNLYKKFNVTVYARLPVPVISSQCSSSSSLSSSLQQNCSLVCSVVNVGHVTLSWYKGNSLLSSISVSDLSISLSLPLEVEYQDKNSYSCVINNPISNQTQHLDITQLCHTCSASDSSTLYIVLGCLSALAVVAVLCGIFYYYHHRRSKQAGHQSQHDGEENIRLTDVTGNAGDANRLNIAGAETPDQERHSQNNTFVEKDEIKSVSAMVGETVTLHTDVTEIQEDELIRWKFADSKTGYIWTTILDLWSSQTSHLNTMDITNCTSPARDRRSQRPSIL